METYNIIVEMTKEDTVYSGTLKEAIHLAGAIADVTMLSKKTNYLRVIVLDANGSKVYSQVHHIDNVND
jgi:hypothetical protein